MRRGDLNFCHPERSEGSGLQLLDSSQKKLRLTGRVGLVILTKKKAQKDGPLSSTFRLPFPVYLSPLSTIP